MIQEIKIQHPVSLCSSWQIGILALDLKFQLKRPAIRACKTRRSSDQQSLDGSPPDHKSTHTTPSNSACLEPTAKPMQANLLVFLAQQVSRQPCLHLFSGPACAVGEMEFSVSPSGSRAYSLDHLSVWPDTGQDEAQPDQHPAPDCVAFPAAVGYVAHPVLSPGLTSTISEQRSQFAPDSIRPQVFDAFRNDSSGSSTQSSSVSSASPFRPPTTMNPELQPDSSAASVKKRRRLPLSCEQCRRRKVK
jgi:hypothetical protein